MALRRLAKGYTLLELLITLAVAAVLLSIAAPSFENLIVTTKADEARNDLYSMFQFARSKAISDKSTVTVCPLDDSGSCTSQWKHKISVFEDANSNSQLEPDDQVIRTLSLDMGDWNVLKIPTSRPQFQWNAIGTANGSAGSLEICNPKSQKGARALIISFAGRVRTSLDYDHNGIDERSPGASIDCQ
ncbi:GspH/FimT family pseudopilin [Marinobacter sp. NFXS9]|uniref:GspH/FimT family pseudopilin n=1 Tax=Marinobacter sp. NFXS9 TaxID=2818433 RepID=UPI0032DED275